MANTYKVVGGDAASLIAKKFGTTVKELQAANPQYQQFVSNPNYIQAGWTLNLPGAAPTPATPATPAPAATPAPVIAPPVATSVATANQPAPTTLSPFVLNTSQEPTSDALKSYTSFDDIKKLLSENQSKVDSFKVPTAEENALNQQLADIRAKADAEVMGTKEYESKLSGEGISAGAIEGRSANVERDVNLTLERLGIQEKNLLTRLGLAQEARQLNQTIAEGQYGNTKDMISYAFEIQDRLDEQKRNLLAETQNLTDNARKSLDTNLNSFAGTDFRKLPTSAQLEIQTLANRVGIPMEVILAGMDVAKNQLDFNNMLQLQKQAQDQKSAGGLTTAQINATVNQIAQAFDNEPIVKNFNVLSEAKAFVDSMPNDTKNPTDDQGLIYSLAKALDPTSVVREGEYATVQKYAQSLTQAYGKSVTQAIAGTGFLSATARQNIKDTINSRYNASYANYQNTFNEYQRRIGEAKGGKFNSLTDYSKAYPGGTQVPGPVDQNTQVMDKILEEQSGGGQAAPATNASGEKPFVPLLDRFFNWISGK